MSDSTPITPNSDSAEVLDSVANNASEEVQTPANRSAKTRQLLGMKGAASGETSIWKIRVQLMKPITWIPLIWGVVCGAASSGEYTWTLENFLKSATCMLLAGPLLTGYTQILNDYYDREIDAINEPYRPIPSGAISIPQVITQIWVLFISGIAVAFVLDKWAGHEFPTITVMALFGSFLAYIYSAPPLKLKQNGWLGSYALGASYIALPWCTGHALFGETQLENCSFDRSLQLGWIGNCHRQRLQECRRRSPTRVKITTRYVWRQYCSLDLRHYDRCVSGSDRRLSHLHPRAIIRSNFATASHSANDLSRYVLSA